MPTDTLWIYVTIAAAALQTTRTAYQRLLAHKSGDFIATYVRYAIGAPAALAALAIAIPLSGAAPVFPLSRVLLLCLLGGVMQILGTMLLLYSFRQRSYAVGTIFSKTEAIQVALVSPVLLGEIIRPLAWAGILVSFAGVFLLAVASRRGGRGAAGLDLASVAVGLGSGLMFALTSICIRASAVSVEHPWTLMQALLVLAVMTSIQVLVMTPIVALRQRHAAMAALRQPLLTGTVGVTSIIGSVGWFFAMALENPAKVQTLGQVEAIFAVLVSHLWFKERLSPGELAGIASIVLGVCAVLASR